jgi:hypothetical protein
MEATTMATPPNPDAARPDRIALLRQIIELLAQTGPEQPTAVGISLLDGEVEFAVKPLDDADVVRALGGFHAPRSWEAFAVVAPGVAHRLDSGQSQRIVIGALAARDGFTATALTGLADPPSDGGDGRVLDACRRVLGLPTAPPTHGPELWAATHWVDAILGTVVGADLGQVPSWDTLRALDRGARYAGGPWSVVRRRCASGRLRIPSIDARGAAWMDDGMFSREALTAYPPITELVADLRQLLPWSTYEAVLRALCERLEASVPVRDRAAPAT